jgi:predicted nucleotide-binding protein
MWDIALYRIVRRRPLATRRTVPPQPQPANLTIEQMKLGITRLERRIADLEKFDPSMIQKRWGPEVEALATAIEETLASVFGHNTIEYNRYRDAANLDDGPSTVQLGPNFRGRGAYDDRHEAQQSVAEGIKRSTQLLRQAIRGLEEEIADRANLAPGPIDAAPAIISPAHNRKVFVVHGREEGPREGIARFLERLGFQPIILHEQANQGRTVIEKVEDHSDVGFAVIILTPDDMGNLKGEEPQPRARQNVLLELGYFIGKLTRKRVCTLKVGELEIHSDWRDVVDEPYDAGGGWRQTLARELEAAEYEIDWNRVMRP